MITVTGKVENAAGEPIHVLVTFESRSTPLVGAGVITGNTLKSVRTLPDEGTFEIELKAGNYRVTYTDGTKQTQFDIQLSPDDDGEEVSIEDVVSTPLSFIATAPNTIWNGVRAGHITFEPISNPPAPTVSAVDYLGGEAIGHSGGVDYAWTYVTAEGETAIGTEGSIAASSIGIDKAARVTAEISPTRVTAKRLWRRCPSVGAWLLVGSIGPSVAYLDDWESEASLIARDDSSRPLEFNTTAGIIYSAPGIEVLYFSTSGLRALTPARFDGDVSLVGGLTIGFLDPGGAFTASSARWTSNETATLFFGGDNLLLTVQGDGGFNIVTGGVLNISILGNTPVNGYVLTCDGDGNATWQAPTGGSGGGGISGSGSPEGVETATPGTQYLDEDTNELWWKKTGTGNTGWVQLI